MIRRKPAPGLDPGVDAASRVAGENRRDHERLDSPKRIMRHKEKKSWTDSS
jgi:hypothetical protein